jgi:SAM-dependent methyltransferase
MGLIYVDLKLLILARRRGARFSRIATIGRQRLALHPYELNELSAEVGNPSIFDRYTWKDFCEPYLIALLRAEEIISIDVSGYENATIIHDMNEPAEDLAEQFDLVIDGGSLQHVFNFPVAVLNIMRMVRVGGHALICSPANNLCGEGFYQFSPELMYRVFSHENGFAVSEMLLTEHFFGSVELAPPRQIMRVRDPKEVGRPALIITGKPLMVRTLAAKISHTNGFLRPPQHSHDVAKWNDTQTKVKTGGSTKKFLKRLYRRCPLRIQYAINQYHARFNLSNRSFFVPWRGRTDEEQQV